MVLRFFKFYFRNILILLPSARASPSNGHIVRFLQTVTDILTSSFYWKEYRRARPLQNDECQILLQKHSNSTAICSCIFFKWLHRAFPSNDHRQSNFYFLLEGISSCAPLQNDECQILLQKHSNSTAICSCVSFKRLHRAFPSNDHRQSNFCFL